MNRPGPLLLSIGLSALGCGQPAPERPLLELHFAHVDHEEVNCVTCHHNFVDDTGNGLCFDCHKTDPAVAPLIEMHFHGFCRGCHAERRAEGEASGPVRACNACHEADELP